MKGMKGISPIIATILLLLIVIAIVGFTFGFFQNIFQTSATAAESQLDQTNRALGKSIRIDNAQGSLLVVRNTGTIAITAATELTVYRIDNGAVVTCSGGWTPASIAAGGVATCTLPAGQTCPDAAITGFKITSPANEDSANC